ncbi:MAG: hypothetical protein JXQ71_08010 [Verrucomicrobia bacterium]|nr:hypothetical protein [Verrucomicrobiota bacterium]
MPDSNPPLDLTRLKAQPLETRHSLSRLEEILVEPTDAPRPCPPSAADAVQRCATAIRDARRRGATVLLIYGAHLIKNGGQLLLNQLMDRGLVTHLATNGAGTIHDWEFSFLGRSTESVRDNVATGTFGAWDETGRNIHLALLAGGLRDEGYGQALGRFIYEDGVTLPAPEELETALRQQPAHSLAPARAELLQAMRLHALAPGRHMVLHPWRNTSVLAQATRHGVPLTVHPGIGYDIIAVHPMFNGAVIGRAAAVDFRRFTAAVEGLDGGVVLSIGSAIMGPQVFEKSLSCVNNLRLQDARPIVTGHHFFVVDLHDGGNWDWTVAEPPKDNPAYYLRFCKSYSRMGGTMRYVQCDNILFLHHLFRTLERIGH